jgi:hypothetical protein
MCLKVDQKVWSDCLVDLVIEGRKILSDKTTIIFPYVNNGLSFITETDCVCCAVRTGCLNIIQARVHLFFSVLTVVQIRLLCKGNCSHFQFTHMYHSAPYQTLALSAPTHFPTFLSLNWRTKPATLLFPVSVSFLLHSQFTRHSLQLYNPTQLPFLLLISELQSDVSLPSLQSATSLCEPRQRMQLNLHISSKIKSKCINFQWQHHIHKILVRYVHLLCVLVEVVVVTDRSIQCQIKISVKRFVRSVLWHLSVEKVSKRTARSQHRSIDKTHSYSTNLVGYIV